MNEVMMLRWIDFKRISQKDTETDALMGIKKKNRNFFKIMMVLLFVFCLVFNNLKNESTKIESCLSSKILMIR
jgi:hypothetical protein